MNEEQLGEVAEGSELVEVAGHELGSEIEEAIVRDCSLHRSAYADPGLHSRYSTYCSQADRVPRAKDLRDNYNPMSAAAMLKWPEMVRTASGNSGGENVGKWRPFTAKTLWYN